MIGVLALYCCAGLLMFALRGVSSSVARIELLRMNLRIRLYLHFEPKHFVGGAVGVGEVEAGTPNAVVRDAKVWTLLG